MIPVRSTPKPFSPLSLFLSFALCTVILVFCLFSNDQFFHWFVIPVFLCGVLIGIDLMDWLQGHLDLYDPIGIISILGFHFFFTAPLLHIGQNHWLPYVVLPPEWQPWLGWMAVLNLFGLLMYRLSRSWGRPPEYHRPPAVSWPLHPQRFWVVLILTLTVAFLLQTLFYAQNGGISGYLDAVEQANQTASGQTFKGSGWIFLISERFPVLAMMGFVFYAQDRPALKTWRAFALVMLAFVVVQLFFGGLGGSRATTIWALFWAGGIFHLWIRPIPRSRLALGLVFVVIFMYFYGFYKEGGIEGVQAALEGRQKHENAPEARDWKSLLLQDLARTDVQAFILYQIMRPDSTYNLAWGRTYLGSVSLLIPGSIWPSRPETKVREGTEALFGRGTFDRGQWRASNVYGLGGETLLNFGPLMVPIMYVILGLVVRQVRIWLFTWPKQDGRRLMLPMLINACFIVLVGDSDNVLFDSITLGSVPFFVILVSTKRQVDRRSLPWLANGYVPSQHSLPEGDILEP